MKTNELIKTLKIASESETDLAKKMLFIYSAERLQKYADYVEEINANLAEVQAMIESKSKEQK